jgi:hypothetical protein
MTQAYELRGVKSSVMRNLLVAFAHQILLEGSNPGRIGGENLQLAQGT